GLQAHEMPWDAPAGVGQTFLISGLATRFEMMRGEESEIIGLMTDPALAAFSKRSLVILPGTHSKHVWIDDQRIVDFRTFMTGEFFDVLGRHSILSASVDVAAHAPQTSFSASDRVAVEEGVKWGSDHGLARGLFRVRTRAVLDRS